MTEAKKVEIIYYHLRLSEEDARIMMGLVQNPIIHNEDERIKKFRERIWTTLEKIGCKP